MELIAAAHPLWGSLAFTGVLALPWLVGAPIIARHNRRHDEKAKR